MNNWKSLLHADATSWLLEDANPSVRFFTLVDIVGKASNDPEVEEARNRIMQTGIVPQILSKQAEGGYWGIAQDFYVRAKYRGTVWTLIVLAELGADGRDKRVKKACEFILENSQDQESGGFSYRRDPIRGGLHNGVSPCLTGNMVYSLIRLGYLNDARVQRGIKWIVNYQRFDDGVEDAPRGWPYDGREKCFGKHTCHMGVVKALKALGEIPVHERSKAVKKTMEKGCEHMLKHHIYKRSRNLSQISKLSWLKFGFPNMWNTDALEILDIMTKLGYREPRMQDAVDLVVSKQNEEGKWTLENTFNGRFQARIEQRGKPSKWITLTALRTLKRYYT